MSLNKNSVFRSSRTWTLLAAMMVAAFLHASDASTENAGGAGKSASARLTITAVVMPVVQTFNPATRKETYSSVLYNFASRHFVQRYDIRKLPGDKAPGGKSSGQAVLQTLTIVPE
jgi:hypothetical protein